jgi:hypothetical protein
MRLCLLMALRWADDTCIQRTADLYCAAQVMLCKCLQSLRYITDEHGSHSCAQHGVHLTATLLEEHWGSCLCLLFGLCINVVTAALLQGSGW